MILKVRMQNFESHEDTEIEFTEGMNLIVGQSNSGKSSILRALRMVVDNEWNKDMVRNGYEYCRVRVTTDKGWVEAERGEKINRWRCQENKGELQEYKKVGTSVPELATKILGMGQRERGAGIKELPNFQSQLEKHYMLSEIGEKKSTSGLVAVMMDNAIGLGGMEELIKDFSTDMQRDRKWMSSTQEDIEGIRKGMVDETLFESYGKQVGSIGKSVEELGTMSVALDRAEALMERHDGLKTSLDGSTVSLSLYPDFKRAGELSDDITALSAGISSMSRAQSLSGSIEKSSSPLSIDTGSMMKMASECESLNERIRLCRKGDDLSGRLVETRPAASIDTAPMAEAVSSIQDMNTRIKEAERRLEDARRLWKSRADVVKEARALASDQESAEEDLERLKKSLGICPLCGNKLQ